MLLYSAVFVLSMLLEWRSSRAGSGAASVILAPLQLILFIMYVQSAISEQEEDRAVAASDVSLNMSAAIR